jgi:hypothetical protein
MAFRNKFPFGITVIIENLLNQIKSKKKICEAIPVIGHGSQ